MKTAIIISSAAVCLTIFMTGAMINRSQLSIFDSAECSDTPTHQLLEI
jgi:hypothetical protein